MNQEFCYSSLTVQKLQEDAKNSIPIIQKYWDSIPVFEPDQPIPHDGLLYKFFGMIQDMPNPVFYFSKYEVVNNETGTKTLKSGKYLETLPCEENESLVFESDVCENAERRPYFMVPIPGLSDWVIEARKKIMVQRKPPYSCPVISQSRNAGKRSAEEMEVEEPECATESGKHHCPTSSSQESTSTPDNCTKSLNDKNSIGCLVTLYDLSDDIKLNDVLEVVGFLYPNPDVDDDEFEDSYKSPTSLTPRLHAVAFKKVTNCNPLFNTSDITDQSITEKMSAIKKDLDLILTHLFFGDKMIADYVLLHLIAQIYHRDSVGALLGKFSVNICNLPDDFSGKEFFKIISKLVPKAQYIDFTVEDFNKVDFVPKKNYTTGNLEPGVLQLSNKTHLIVNEINLEVGKLEDRGVRNVKALSDVIKRQKMEYDFTYYTVGFDTDIPVIALSITRSLLPTDFTLPLSPAPGWTSSADENFESVNKFLSEERLNNIRTYISIAANFPVTVPNEMSNHIQEEFVKLRQADKEYSPDDLHELLVLGRFISASYGKSTIDIKSFEEAKYLQSIRKATKF